MIILHLARKHRGRGCLLYDRQFRQQKAAGADLPWAEINPSLMAATVLSNPGALQPKACPYCLSADHNKEECALASFAAPSVSNPPPLGQIQGPSGCQSRRPVPYKSPDTTCRRFDRGNCESADSRNEHICSGCHRPGQPVHNCKGKGRPGENPWQKCETPQPAK